MFENLLDLLWIFFVGFVFVAYLMTLFSVVGDLFRDRELSGWWKAIWMIFLIFVPFLTVLVYLIARGKGMAERDHRNAQAAKQAADDYIRSVATNSPAEEIAKAKQLLEAGTISQAEFDALKARVLA